MGVIVTVTFAEIAHVSRYHLGLVVVSACTGLARTLRRYEGERCGGEEGGEGRGVGGVMRMVIARSLLSD